MSVVESETRLSNEMGMDRASSERFSRRRKPKLVPADRVAARRIKNASAMNGREQQCASLSRSQRLPLSHAQERLWFIDCLEGGRSTEYNMAFALRLRGELDEKALERAINTIVERHESLRTHFEERDGEPEQVIEAEVQIAVPVEDLTGMEEEEEKKERVKEALRREVEEAFDLGRGPMLRVGLVKLGEQEHVLLRTVHHIVWDGWSEGVFNRELMVLYEAYREGRKNPLKPLEVQYADFAIWHREWLQGGALDEGLKYWREQLAGIPERLELPTDQVRPAVQTFGAKACCAKVSAELTAGLKRISQEKQATLYMALLAAFGVLLSRYSGQDDIVVGSPIANREDAKLEEMIGFFANTLAIRMQVCPKQSFLELLRQVRQTALDACEHQDMPFERLVKELSPQRSLGVTPVVQVLFAMGNVPFEPKQMKGLEVERLESDELRVRFDLEVHAWERGGEIGLYWLYNRDLFDRWRIEQIVGQYLRILQEVAADPEQKVGQIDLLGSEDRRKMLVEWNETAHEVPQATLPALFEEQVKKTPEAVAVVCEEQQLSYGELNIRANRLAHYLIGRGVGPEDIVGIAGPRSAEMIVGLLGILKAGAAYLPLDPDYPVERLRFMVEDARPVCILATKGIGATLADQKFLIELDVPETSAVLARHSSSNPRDRGAHQAAGVCKLSLHYLYLGIHRHPQRDNRACRNAE